MMPNPNAPGQKRKNRTPVPDAPVTPGASVSLRREGGYLYGDAQGFDPGTINSDFQSQPVHPDNPSNKGIGVGLYTSDDDGTVSFPILEQYIIPDFPRTVTVTIWDDLDPPTKATATQTYTS